MEQAAAPIKWFLNDIIQMNRVNIIAADGGSGKSTMATDFMSAASTGRRIPLHEGAVLPPSASLLICEEEHVGEEIAPRLIAAGADRDLTHFLSSDLLQNDGHIKGELELRKHGKLIEKWVRELNIKLLIIDPISDYIDGDQNANTVVRKALKPLSRIAQNTDCTIIAITHVTKDDERDLRKQIMGSSGQVNAARCAAIIKRDDRDEERITIQSVKANNKRHGPSGYAFKIVTKWAQTKHLDDPIETRGIEFIERLGPPAKKAASLPLKQVAHSTAAMWLKKHPEGKSRKECIAHVTHTMAESGMDCSEGTVKDALVMDDKSIMRLCRKYYHADHAPAAALA